MQQDLNLEHQIHIQTHILLYAVSYMAMLDGIQYAIKNNKTEDELLAELSKEPGENADYLEKIELIELKKMYLKIIPMKKEINILEKHLQQFMKT